MNSNSKSNKIDYEKFNLSWLISISGITFWFVTGFPFSHNYESFYWMKEYYSGNLIPFIFQPVGHYLSYRPLGQLVCLILFELSDGGLSLIQLFNYAVTISAIFLIIKAFSNRSLISLLFLFMGGFIFPVFSYLFHLNGLFYAGTLLLLGVLIYYYNQPWSSGNLTVAFIISITATLFNPFSLFVYVFYLIGVLIENKRLLTKKHKALIMFFIVTEFVLSFLLVPNQFQYMKIESIAGLMNIYSDSGTNLLTKLLIISFQLIAVAGISVPNKLKICMAVVAILLSILFVKFSIPLIFILILILVIKLLIQKKKPLLSLLVVTSLFTIFTGVQPSHMKVYFYFILPVLLSIGYNPSFPELIFKPRFQIALLSGLAIIIFIVKSDIRIPKLSEFTSVLLAKKEQTYQLNEFINWYMSSDYKCNEIKMMNGGKNNSGIPVYESDLNGYLKAVSACQEFREGKIFLSTKRMDSLGAELVWKINGKYASNLYAYCQLLL